MTREYLEPNLKNLKTTNVTVKYELVEKIKKFLKKAFIFKGFVN